MVPEIVQAAFNRNESDLLTKDNVVGVLKGKKIKNGKMTDEDALVVLVKKKVPLSHLVHPVPATVYARWYSWQKVSTDIVVAKNIQATTWGKVVARETTRRQRPALGGNSCSHFKGTAGTLGVAAHYNKEKVLLTNNHVAANSNDAKTGDPIYQPGPWDGGRSTDRIADLLKWIPLKFDGTPNFVDAAIAMPARQDDLALGIIGRTESEVIVPDGLHNFSAGQRGPKRGRTTDYTELRCIGVGGTIDVGYGGNRVARFRNCDVFDPPGGSAGGDSGSVIMYGNRMGSLLFAGSDEVTIGNPMTTVFEMLGLTVAQPEPEPEPVPEPEPPPPEPVPEPEPQPEPPTPAVEPIEPVEILTVYVGGKVAIKAIAAVEDGKIVVR